MSLNTEQFRRVISKTKGQGGKLVQTAFGGVSVGLFIYLYTNFAQLKDVEHLREWVKALSQARTEQVHEMDQRLDNIEKQLYYLNGLLNVYTVHTNKP